jgi:hypothetical protein
MRHILTLARTYVGTSVSHALFAMPLSRAWCQSYDTLLYDILAWSVGEPLGEKQRALVAAPIREGGFGFTLAEPRREEA